MIKNQQKIDFNFFWIVKKEKEKNERKNEDDKSKGKRGSSKKRLFNRILQSLEKGNNQKIISVYKLKNKENNKSAEKPIENKSELKNEDNFKSYNICKTEENINKMASKMNLNEILINNNNYKKIDLNQNDNCTKINANILRNNDKDEEYEINLKNKIDEKFINDDKNSSELFYKRILINPSKGRKLSGKLNLKIYKSPIAKYIKKRNNLEQIKNMKYKTIEERQILNGINNLCDKYEIDVNDNNFNQIIFGNLGDKSSKSIKNSRIYDDKNFRAATGKYFCQSYNEKKINYINLKSYNKTRDNSSFSSKNNTNFNQIKSYSSIDNNKRNGSKYNIYINKAKIVKRQSNNNIYKFNNYY